MSLQERLRLEADAIHCAPSGQQVGDTFHAANWADKPHRVAYDAANIIREAAAELDRLQARVAELEVDAERLDWIDSNPTSVRWAKLPRGSGWGWTYKWSPDELPLSLRTAIDTARKAKP